MLSQENVGPKQDISELSTLQVERPWGYFRQFCKNAPVTVKLLVVHPNEILSLQSHSKRTEFWRVLAGSGEAEINEQLKKINIGDELVIPVQTKHRLAASPEGLEILEISFGDFDENDILRFEDKYGRI